MVLIWEGIGHPPFSLPSRSDEWFSVYYTEGFDNFWARHLFYMNSDINLQAKGFDCRNNLNHK